MSNSMNYCVPVRTIKQALSVDDVAIVPGVVGPGKLESRSNAEIKPFIYSSPMDTVTGYELTAAMVEAGEFAVVSRFIPFEEREYAVLSWHDNPNVFFAFGIKNGDLQCLRSTCSNHGLEFNNMNLALDVAHGDMELAHVLVRALRRIGHTGKIMSGSICTPEAASRCIEAGCTHLRVGIGPGAACSTRVMTGVGVPNFTAVMEIWERTVWHQPPIQIIADGGIRSPGDAAKYLGAGAHGVMLGSVLSKTKEAAGWVEIPHPSENQLVKSFRGQASAKFQKDQFEKAGDYTEGVSFPLMTWDGETTVRSVINRYKAGLASMISYVGLTSSEELNPVSVRFRRITPAGALEGKPQTE